MPNNSTMGHFGRNSEIRTVGRAEVIRQLDHASFKSLWRSRNQSGLKLRSSTTLTPNAPLGLIMPPATNLTIASA
jgi:hypothetical protein